MPRTEPCMGACAKPTTRDWFGHGDWHAACQTTTQPCGQSLKGNMNGTRGEGRGAECTVSLSRRWGSKTKGYKRGLRLGRAQPGCPRLPRSLHPDTGDRTTLEGPTAGMATIAPLPSGCAPQPCPPPPLAMPRVGAAGTHGGPCSVAPGTRAKSCGGLLPLVAKCGAIPSLLVCSGTAAALGTNSTSARLTRIPSCWLSLQFGFRFDFPVFLTSSDCLPPCPNLSSGRPSSTDHQASLLPAQTSPLLWQPSLQTW